MMIGRRRFRQVLMFLIVLSFGTFAYISFKGRSLDHADPQRYVSGHLRVPDPQQHDIIHLNDADVGQHESRPVADKMSAELAPQRHEPTSLEEFQRRRARLEEGCRRRQGTKPLHPPFGYKIVWVPSLALAFCPLPKTGTTTWKRILYYMDNGLKGRLLDTQYGDIHEKVKYMQNPKLRLAPGEKYTGIVFVREPYARLFSAYVDKLFTPRRSNWIKYGRPVLYFMMASAAGRVSKSQCAHDITFEEFVRYFIAVETQTVKGERRDEHFVPVSNQCGFCKRSYDLIGRQESFADDTLGMLAQFNMSGVMNYSDFNDDYVKYEMQALIRYTFEHELKTIRQCMSPESALKRLWKALQIRGAIGAEEFFPLSAIDCETIEKDSFLEIATAAHEKSLKDPSRIWNRLEAMHEAFSRVDIHDRLQLQKIFADDFEFFDYNPNNPYVFPENDEFQLPYYRYFDLSNTFLYLNGVFQRNG